MKMAMGYNKASRASRSCFRTASKHNPCCCSAQLFSFFSSLPVACCQALHCFFPSSLQALPRWQQLPGDSGARTNWESGDTGGSDQGSGGETEANLPILGPRELP